MGLVHIALSFDDVDAAYARALAAGADSVQSPTSFTLPEWRVRLAFVDGPSGERIELYRTTLNQ